MNSDRQGIASSLPPLEDSIRELDLAELNELKRMIDRHAAVLEANAVAAQSLTFPEKSQSRKETECADGFHASWSRSSSQKTHERATSIHHLEKVSESTPRSDKRKIKKPKTKVTQRATRRPRGDGAPAPPLESPRHPRTRQCKTTMHPNDSTTTITPLPSHHESNLFSPESSTTTCSSGNSSGSKSKGRKHRSIEATMTSPSPVRSHPTLQRHIFTTPPLPFTTDTNTTDTNSFAHMSDSSAFEAETVDHPSSLLDQFSVVDLQDSQWRREKARNIDMSQSNRRKNFLDLSGRFDVINQSLSKNLAHMKLLKELEKKNSISQLNVSRSSLDTTTTAATTTATPTTPRLLVDRALQPTISHSEMAKKESWELPMTMTHGTACPRPFVSSSETPSSPTRTSQVGHDYVWTRKSASLAIKNRPLTPLRPRRGSHSSTSHDANNNTIAATTANDSNHHHEHRQHSSSSAQPRPLKKKSSAPKATRGATNTPKANSSKPRHTTTSTVNPLPPPPPVVTRSPRGRRTSGGEPSAWPSVTQASHFDIFGQDVDDLSAFDSTHDMVSWKRFG
jgi:hypothetical protein